MTHPAVTEALKHLPAKSPAPLKKFLQDFFEAVPAEDLALMTPELMADTAQLHYDLGEKRKKNQPAIVIRTLLPAGADSGIGRTIIDIVNDDMAFLVDSVAAELGRNHRLITLLVHPVMPGRDGGKTDSHMHIHLQGTLAKSQIPDLERDLRAMLRDVRDATKDWLVMREKLKECHAALDTAPAHFKRADIEEYKAFLDYLYNDNFTLLGYREYVFTDSGKKLGSRVVAGSSLGLLHDDSDPVYVSENIEGLPQDLQKLRRDLPPLTIAKVNRRSTVHRPVPLDAIAVKTYDSKGKVTGERIFIGLFTSVTYSRSIQDIPILRRKAESIVNRKEFKTGSHSYKALRHILEKFPRDELLQIETDELEKTVLSILRLQERQRIALFTRRDPFRRYISCLVYIPRDRYDPRLRVAIQKILESELSGACADYQTNLDDSLLARVIYTIKTRQENPPHYKTKIIEARLQEAGRLWPEKLAAALLAVGVPETEMPEIVHRYGHAFPFAYQERYLPKQAVYDLQKADETLKTESLTLDLYQDKSCAAGQVRLKIYSAAAPVPLSSILPVLEDLGLAVISELPFEIKPADADKSVWIHDFLMTVTAGALDEAGLAQRKPVFEEALLRIWRKDLESDPLNQLILGAGMNWRDVMALRAYIRYLRQARSPYSTTVMERTLCRNAGISGDLIRLFHALHDPHQTAKTRKQAADGEAAIAAALERVVSLDEDRILRSLLGLIRATLRTNFFQPDKDGHLKNRVAFKFDSRAIADLPEPRPYREIFVYSPRVEGIHLRNDVIARGGIRWSDRLEDFRTEVLSLMKAQQVKNSLIVPMGAKGGFVLKTPPPGNDRAAFQKEGVECYKIFVRSLLEITDNRKGKKVVPPPHVTRRDGDDPYLVVAADKGTATFSDIANSLSAEFGFWLGDAFASGGSAGYDHKKMGITARGAWESVMRHFRELNHDTQKKPFDVVGVGDMGGDVFGNGMLRSPFIRLIGAFNHVHIFCDPDPDPVATFAERQRLFDAVKGWEEYDQKKLSKGGRIFNRADKSLSLTPEIMKRFDIGQEKVTPAELIQAMLRARTDLMFFGGIGTYVKAAGEAHGNVGDKTNDSLRIDARDLRAKVIGEGANLAMTLAARIEAAERGIKLNADFIDNSGGVNSSDIEVNIKILMSDIVANPAYGLTLPKRNALLAKMTDEVAQLVLRNNYQQAQAISLMELRSPENLSYQMALIEDLEKNHGLNRKLEGLPDRETLETRLRAGKGLLRPELCTLQAHSKIIFTRDILASDIPDQPVMEDHWLINYFPKPLQKSYAAEIRGHRLKREIIATMLATSLVNRMGPTFVREVMARTGATAADVAKAYLIVRESFGLRHLWDEIESLDGKVQAQVQLKAMREIGRMVERETLWFLTRYGHDLDIGRDISLFGKSVEILRQAMDNVVTGERAASVKQRLQSGISEGLPRTLAQEIAIISPLGAVCDITRISRDQKTDLIATARVYFELGEHFHLHWLRQQARFLSGDSRWTSEALEGIINTVYACQAGMAARILKETKGKGSKPVASWAEKHSAQVRQYETLLADIREAGSIDVPMLTVASQKLVQIQG